MTPFCFLITITFFVYIVVFAFIHPVLLNVYRLCTMPVHVVGIFVSTSVFLLLGGTTTNGLLLVYLPCSPLTSLHLSIIPYFLTVHVMSTKCPTQPSRLSSVTCESHIQVFVMHSSTLLNQMITCLQEAWICCITCTRCWNISYPWYALTCLLVHLFPYVDNLNDCCTNPASCCLFYTWLLSQLLYSVKLNCLFVRICNDEL